jgi:colanic acid biosynthesis protein WcaH
MDINDQYIPDDVFTEFLAQMPQVCVELLFETTDGVLLCKRETKPEVWFWPGSRLYKGERLESAARRVAREELGVAVTVEERLGIHEHFWEAQETEEGVSRHTVNIVYRASPADPDFTISLDEQHSDYQFVREPAPDFHQYVHEYLQSYVV